jgi:hypothetical protein
LRFSSKSGVELKLNSSFVDEAKLFSTPKKAWPKFFVGDEL